MNQPQTRRYEIELRGRYVEELEKLAAEHLYDDVARYASVLLRNALWEIAENKQTIAMTERGTDRHTDLDDDIPF